jgi:hypothetical protein
MRASEDDVWAALNTPADEGEDCLHSRGVGCTCWPIHHSSEAAPALSSLLIDSQDLNTFVFTTYTTELWACFLKKNSPTVPPSRYKCFVHEICNGVSLSPCNSLFAWRLTFHNYPMLIYHQGLVQWALRRPKKQRSQSHLTPTNNPTLLLFSVIWRRFQCRDYTARIWKEEVMA